MTWQDTEHIVSDPEIQHGELTIRGTRFPVRTVHNWMIVNDEPELFYLDYPNMRGYEIAVNAAAALPPSVPIIAWGHDDTVSVERGWRPGYVEVTVSDLDDIRFDLPITDIDRHIEQYAAALRAAASEWESVQG